MTKEVRNNKIPNGDYVAKDDSLFVIRPLSHLFVIRHSSFVIVGSD
jgi:hypothetical protein